MRELALHACRDKIPRPSLRGSLQRVLAPPRARERLADLVLRGEDDRGPQVHLREQKWVSRGVLRGDLFEARRIGPTDEVIRKVEQVDRDARLEERIPDLRQDLVELRPSEVEGFEVLQASRAEDAALHCLASAGEPGKETLRVSARERRERLLPQ